VLFLVPTHKKIRERGIIFKIYNSFSELIISILVSLDPRSKQAKIQVFQVRNPHISMLLLLGQGLNVGKMIFVANFLVIPKKISNL
jgi:hypothetical protein